MQNNELYDISVNDLYSFVKEEIGDSGMK